MKKLLIILLILMALCACTSNVPADAEYNVYRVIDSEHQTDGQLICTEPLIIENGETELEAILSALQSEAIERRARNPLLGIEIKDITISDGSAILELDMAFLKLPDLEKSLIGACCTLSLCQLSTIDRLSITVGSEVVLQNLTSSDMYTDSSSVDTFMREVCLYYTDAGRQKLIPEYRTLSLTASAQPERYVVDELFRSLASRNLYSPLPEGTALLSTTRKGRVCTINLSSEFVDNMPETATGEILAVYSLVNSLTSLGNISEVQITVEGHTIEKYFNLSLSSPLTGLDFLNAARISSGAPIGARLYYASGDKLFGVPCVVDGKLSLPQQLLDLLMSSKNFGGYDNLFSASDELSYISTSSGLCRISLSRSFFEKRTPKQAEQALDALIMTLISLDDITSVSISYPDGTVPQVPDRNLTLPQMQISSEILQ